MSVRTAISSSRSSRFVDHCANFFANLFILNNCRQIFFVETVRILFGDVDGGVGVTADCDVWCTCVCGPCQNIRKWMSVYENQT